MARVSSRSAIRNANYDDLAGINDVVQALINKAGQAAIETYKQQAMRFLLPLV